jgi:hypothetical protein
VDAYDIVLGVHLASVVVLLAGIAVFSVCYLRLRAAGSHAEAAPWLLLAARTGWLFPVAVAGLLGSGAYLTVHRWAWTTAWIDVSIAGLVLVALQGPIVAGPRSVALARAIERNGPGPLGEAARRAARATALWLVLLTNPGVVLAIAWNMVAQPGAAAAIVAVAAGYAVGAVASVPLSRPR